MARYQPRTKRVEPGRYRLFFGRGQKKLSCIFWFNDLAKGWCISEGDGASNDDVAGPFGKKKDLMAAWGEWAEKIYESDEAESPSSDGQPSESKPTPLSRKGPPKHKPSLKEKGPPKREKKPNPDASTAVDQAGKPAQAMLTMLDWAWRNRKDLNQLPWRDAMAALHEIDPDLYAHYKLKSP